MAKASAAAKAQARSIRRVNSIPPLRVESPARSRPPGLPDRDATDPTAGTSPTPTVGLSPGSPPTGSPALGAFEGLHTQAAHRPDHRFLSPRGIPFLPRAA